MPEPAKSAPKKGSKKAVTKTVGKGGKKRRKSRKESYAIYVYKVLKQVHPDTGISSKAMGIMNSFVNDIFERIAGESSRLAHYNKRSTITSREIQTAVRLLLPGELAKHAVSEGTKAVTKYTSSKAILLALWLFGSSCAIPDSSINECKKTVNVPVLGVLPGGGWDNLRNLDMGRVMNMSYSLCQTTEDGAYLLPDEVFTVPQKSTKVEISSELIKTWTDQKSATARSINVEVSFTPFINGKFSAENQRMKEHQVKEDSYTSRTEVRNFMYSVKARPGFSLDGTFKSRVMEIASALEINETRLASFLSETLVLDYGTHVVDAGLNFKDSDKLSQTYKGNTTYSLILSHGGTPFYPGISLQRWQESIGNNLVALDRSGLPLPFFLNKETLSDLQGSTIQKLASTVSKAIQCYYTVNTYPGCTKPESPNYNYQANVDDESCDGLTNNLNLGGVFQRCTPLTYDQESQDMCQTLTQKNPMTGATSCEQPYKQTLLRTEEREESYSQYECRRVCDTCWLVLTCCDDVCSYVNCVRRIRVDTYWCAADNNTVPQTPGFLFGGFYSSEVVNPLTNLKTCPSEFLPYALLSDGLKICLSSNYETAERFSVPFGGMFSCESGNPMAGGLSRCPAGFTQHSATISDRCEVLFCASSGAFSQRELAQIKLSPFTRKPVIGQNNTAQAAVVNVRGTTLTTEDGAYLLPDEVFTVPQKSTKVEISSELIKTWTDQKSATARSINIEVSFTPSINGKFSTENQRIKEHQVKEDSYTSRTGVQNSMYSVKARPGFTLDPAFKNRVTQIAIALENNTTRQASFLSETLVLDYDSSINECKKMVNVPLLGVLPGGGWDNLRNLDMGRVMNMSYSLCQTTEDGAYLLPDEVFTVPQKSTKVEINSDIIKSWIDQKSTTARSINSDVSFTPNLNGKFSTENQRIKEHQVKEESYTSHTEVRNSMYSVKARPGFTLDPTFKSCVTQIAIALENNETRLVDFLSEKLVLEYGTHVITFISAGASLMKEDYISTSFVKHSNSHSVAFSASTSFFNQVDFGLNVKQNYKLNEAYEGNTTYSLILSLGGMPFYPGITLQRWQESIGNNLVALDRSGLPLPFLLNKKTLPDLPDPTIQKLASTISKAIQCYYTVNTYPGCTKPGSPNYNYQANVNDESCDGVTKNLNFGGVFQNCTPLTDDQGTQKLCQTLTQKNPQTGETSCNQPYKEIHLRTEVREEGYNQFECRHDCRSCWLLFKCCRDTCGDVYRVQRMRVETYWCAADNSTVPQTPGFLFGGLYSSEMVNPLTKSRRCPSEFLPYTLLSDGLKICLSSNHETAAHFAVPFGGMFSCEAGNPMAGNLSRCPAGFTQHLAAVSDGCEVLFCASSGNFSGSELAQIKLPPFTREPLIRQKGTETVAVLNERGTAWVREAGTQKWRKASLEVAQRMVEDFTFSGAAQKSRAFAAALTVILIMAVAVL
ncbi:hypothetical protein JZ751_012976 [Albula glossodonta]|uniref:Histone H2B n=1 Tax=Albula glossodonta TaxID=121402 RepID=A0A8T2MT54_9TELE|nr:hypothetical protein JZ751_012976 [Albula glossodonta]